MTVSDSKQHSKGVLFASVDLAAALFSKSLRYAAGFIANDFACAALACFVCLPRAAPVWLLSHSYEPRVAAGSFLQCTRSAGIISSSSHAALLSLARERLVVRLVPIPSLLCPSKLGSAFSYR